MTRIEIDLNVRTAEGLTRAALRDLEGATNLSVGEPVIVFEPDEDVEAPATVVKVSRDGRFAYLRVQWDELKSATGVLDSYVLTNTPSTLSQRLPELLDVFWLKKGERRELVILP
jgi:hypothetical protein